MKELNQIISMKKPSMNSFDEKSDSSPMSIEDPDEPSPSPINPITLKHTLRLASRVGIQNSSKFSEINVDTFSDTSLLINLDNALNAVSINNLSFSPTPTKAFSLAKNEHNKYNESDQIPVNKSKNKNLKNKVHIQNNNEHTLQTRNHLEQDDLDEEEISKLTENENKEENFKAGSKTSNALNSFPTSKSVRYSKWIRRDTITDFINRYIPRFLIPAFKAIKKLRIRFAIPKKRMKNSCYSTSNPKTSKKNTLAVKKKKLAAKPLY